VNVIDVRPFIQVRNLPAVALTACLRKLLIVLNAMLKHRQMQTQHAYIPGQLLTPSQLVCPRAGGRPA